MLKKQEYLAMLPENLREGLEPLFTRLQNERILELENLIKIIKSDSYQKLINDWQKYLNSNESDSREKPKHANDTIYQLACDIIFKKYRKLVKIGKKISDETTDAEFHLLRIKSKQLRYLIEFFSSLFPPNEISSLIKHLKKLQDILGDYHDLYIQQQNLKHYLKQDDSDSTDSVPYIAAVGGLIAVLHQKQQSIRRNLTGIFYEFNQKSERQIYRQLFNPGDRNK